MAIRLPRDRETRVKVKAPRIRRPQRRQKPVRLLV
jgi:hypothetical protein